jgi:hypothetical protein
MLRALAPVLAPHGVPRLESAVDEFPLDADVANRLIESFAHHWGRGLLQLGAGEAGSRLPPALPFWRAFAMRFPSALCTLTEAAATAPEKPPAPAPDELAAIIDEAPPMRGGEYLRPEVLEALWRSMQQALFVELAESGLTLQDFLKSRDSRWRLVGRVHFNLAENRKDPDYPFAFMATYTSSLAGHGALRHLPLGRGRSRAAEDNAR